jgi:hypothetical protein
VTNPDSSPPTLQYMQTTSILQDQFPSVSTPDYFCPALKPTLSISFSTRRLLKANIFQQVCYISVIIIIIIIVFPVPWSSKWSWSLHLFLGRPMFLRPFGLYCSACFGNLFVSVLCTCCSHFYWYCFISLCYISKLY